MTQPSAGGAVRVAHLMHGLGVGGLEYMVLDLWVRGRERGIEPLIIVLGEDGPLRQVAEARGIPVEHLADVAGLSMAAVRSIGKALDRFGAHVVHGHDLGPWLNAVAARALRPSTAALATFHQVKPPSGPKKPAAMAAALFSKALVACGNEVRADVDTWAPPGANVVTIGNGVSLPPPPSDEQRAEARRQLGLPMEAVVIGSISRLQPVKGPEILLEAFLTRFREWPDVHLVLVGGGPLEAELRARAAGCPNVHLTGQVLDAARLLPAFDVYAQTSRSEGRSLALLEAMAAGLPTVAHALPAMSEVHRAGDTALLVPLGDGDALCDALDTLVWDTARRERMGASARERSRLFSVDAMADAYAELYRKAAAEKA
jgi:glycosyltransferase involved in cell wall biosynthesis